MGIINLARILKGKTGWVSISHDYKKIIAREETLGKLIQKLKKMGNPDGYIINSAKDYSNYVG